MANNNGLHASIEDLEKSIDVFTTAQRWEQGEKVLGTIPAPEREALNRWIRNHTQLATAGAPHYWISILAANAALDRFGAITRENMVRVFEETKRVGKVRGILVPI
jgi:hypothetical protein